MGGIAGIIRFDGQAINPAETDKVIRLLKHRGAPQSQSIKNGVLISFGGEIETADGGTLTVVTDAEVFFSKFADQPFSSHYAHAGPAAFNELNADFAAALWDADKQMLYCARDILGLKPLYFTHVPHRFFAFASEIKGLTVLDEIWVKPNRHQFREYLVWTTANLPYSSDTFYEKIYSILPGHYLKVSADKTEEVAYWRPDFSRFSDLGGIESYASLFRDFFTEAIARRIGNKRKPGADLSGGLDSSSISCTAQALLKSQGKASLATFNIDTRQTLAEEQDYVDDVVGKWHTDHHRLTPLPDVLDAVKNVQRMFDRPEHFIIPSSFHFSISGKAQALGCDLILSGHGGDNVATSGFEFIDDLMLADNWESLQTASRQLYAHSMGGLSGNSRTGSSVKNKSEYGKYMLGVLTRDFKRRYGNESLTSLLGRLKEHKRRFGISDSAIASYLYEKLSDKLTGVRPIASALHPEFARQAQPRERHSTASLVEKILSESGISIADVLNHATVSCNEQMNHIGAYYGYGFSCPFFDKNVIELSLATPRELSFDQGRGRGLIRHGMEQVLPPSIINRTTKADFVEYGTRSAKQLYQATREQLSLTGHPIWEIVDRKVFLKIVDIVFSEQRPGFLKTRYNWQLSRIIYLAIWLDSLAE